MKPTPALELYLRRESSALIDVETQLRELYEFAQPLGSYSPLLQEWYLSSGSSKHEAYLYKAFDSNGPTTQALAYLRNISKGVTDIRGISIWNGADSDADAAGMSSRVNTFDRPDTIEFTLTLQPEVKEWETPCEWLQRAVKIWRPKTGTFGPFWYSEKKVFKDRPGVGWMIYLPRVLTTQQIPEARALVPVMGKDANGKDKQTGTIVVSVTDEPFSDENPEHIKIANSIEIRLVDQDLLPRYSDL